jgi:hypothetical protein
MASFTISIELNNSSPSSYRQLRTLMSGQGFRHSITDKSGTNYRLPRDEYVYMGYETRGELLERVCKTLEEMDPVPGVMVTEAFARTWRNLKEIDLS